MTSWVALFRGINVGGNNIVAMKQLAELLANIGCTDVKTYIQSGNVVMQHSEADSNVLASLIAESVEITLGFQPHILLLTFAQFQQAAANNPFSQAEVTPKTLHCYFLSSEASSPDLQSLLNIKAPSETFELIEQVFYLHAPDGIGRSKLAAKVEGLLGVPVTARNWNTVKKLLSLIDK